MNYSVILAGGSGTRLWPLSRKDRPKQLLPMQGGETLLGISYSRQDGLIPVENRYVCAGGSLKPAALDTLPGFSEGRFIGEPIGRDTLNALALSSAILQRRDPEAVVAVFTADHLIQPEDTFRSVVERGFAAAKELPNSLITFGITPTEPSTGFGYLKLEQELLPGVHSVSSFKEKPDAPTAKKYLAAGAKSYLWNSGMFVWKVSTFMDAVKLFHPENHRIIQEIVAAYGGDEFANVLETLFPRLSRISVDFAVMEPASESDRFIVATLPMSVQWRDIGSWDSYAEIVGEDSPGHSLLLESPGALAVSEQEDHLIAGVGIPGMVVIHTPKATLVCPRSQSNRIKELYEQIKAKYGEEYL